MQAQSGHTIEDIYRGVISDVINQVREAFLDEGADPDVLQQLKKSWENRVNESGAVDLDGTGTKNIPPPVLRQPVPQQTMPPTVHQTMPPAHSSRQQIISSAAPIERMTPMQMPNIQMAGPSVPIAAPIPMMPTMNFQQNLGNLIGNSTGMSQEDVKLLIKNMASTIPQLDGGGGPGMTDSSSESEEDEKEDESLNRFTRLGNENAEDEIPEEDVPLNSDDDQSDDEDIEELFKADDTVVCQFEKVHRARNKWKFILKDGVMNLKGKDYCFQKGNGEAEW